jgi:hypothetical protein
MFQRDIRVPKQLFLSLTGLKKQFYLDFPNFAAFPALLPTISHFAIFINSKSFKQFLTILAMSSHSSQIQPFLAVPVMSSLY